MDLDILPVQAVKFLMVGTKGVSGRKRPFSRPYPRVGMHFSSFDVLRINDDVAFLAIVKDVLYAILDDENRPWTYGNYFWTLLPSTFFSTRKTRYSTVYIFLKNFHLLIKYRYTYITFMTTWICRAQKVLNPTIGLEYN